MSIRLSEQEAWAELERAHTGIFTTLQRNGWPISLPMWFVALDRHIYLRTPAQSKKLTRIRHDSRGNFLVERGERWKELCAVMLRVEVERLEAGEEFDRAVAALARIPISWRNRNTSPIMIGAPVNSGGRLRTSSP